MSNYICRLCFNNIKPEEALLFSNHITEIIQFCIPELDIKLVNNPVLCPECYDELDRMFKFKKKCLKVQEDIIVNKDSNYGASTLSFVKEECMPVTWKAGTGEENGNIVYQSEAEPPNMPSNEEILLPVITNIEHCNKASKSDSHNDITYKISRETSTVRNLVNVKFSHRFCHSCKLSFNNLEKLIEHLYSKHHDIEELYQCMLCRFKLKSLRSVVIHYRKFHPNCHDINTSCFLCVKDTKNFQNLFLHMSSNHSDVCKKTKYKCNSCDYKSKSYFNFRKHFFQSHDFTCNYCSEKCSTTLSLNRHLLKHFRNLI